MPNTSGVYFPHRKIDLVKAVTISTALLISVFSGVCFAGPNDKYAPTETEAIVIGGVIDNVKNTERAIRRISFNSLDNNNRFNFDYLSNKNQLLRKVTQNFYYLDSFETIFENLAPITLDKPQGYQGVIAIKGGSITYIGVWIVNGKRTKIGYELDAITKLDFEYLYGFLKKYPHLREYPLYFASPNKEVVQYSWDYVEAAAIRSQKESN